MQSSSDDQKDITNRAANENSNPVELEQEVKNTSPPEAKNEEAPEENKVENSTAETAIVAKSEPPKVEASELNKDENSVA